MQLLVELQRLNGLMEAEEVEIKIHDRQLLLLLLLL